MHVEEAANMAIETATPMATVYELARTMARCGVGFVPIIEEGQLKGVVTDRDLVVRCLAENRDPLHTDAFDIMSGPPAWVYADEDIDNALRRMVEMNVRRLVVKNRHGRCVGVLTVDDIAKSAKGEEAAGQVLRRVAPTIPATVGLNLGDFDFEE